MTNVCYHLRIPIRWRPMPRLIHHDGFDLTCPTCMAFITPAPTDTLGQSAPRTATA